MDICIYCGMEIAEWEWEENSHECWDDGIDVSDAVIETKPNTIDVFTLAEKENTMNGYKSNMNAVCKKCGKAYCTSDAASFQPIKWETKCLSCMRLDESEVSEVLVPIKTGYYEMTWGTSFFLAITTDGINAFVYWPEKLPHVDSKVIGAFYEAGEIATYQKTGWKFKQVKQVHLKSGKYHGHLNSLKNCWQCEVSENSTKIKLSNGETYGIGALAAAGYYFEPMGKNSSVGSTWNPNAGQWITEHKAEYIPEEKIEYRTQKAKGLQALNDAGFNVPSFSVIKIEDAIRDGSIIASAASMMIDKFVRPCPVNPRHGFVDSRPIRSFSDAEQLIRETIEADKEAEFLIMPFVEAEVSGIWTGERLILGSSNDGATAGHHSYSLPTLGIITDEYQWKETMRKANISDAPYVEMLWKKDKYSSTSFKNYIVQLRNGPKLPNGNDYVTEPFLVKNVFVAKSVPNPHKPGQSVILAEDGSEIDLLAWETDVKQLPVGTAVYHPGGTLASHVAVHSVINNVPVLTTRKPVVGETLVPTVEKPILDVAKMKEGFYLGASCEMGKKAAAYAMLAACHSAVIWQGKQDLLLGFGMGAAYRLTITAAIGEYRHKPDEYGNITRHTEDRDVVYSHVWDVCLEPATRQKFLKAIHSFKWDRWPGNFGGRKWYEFCRLATELFNALITNNPVQAIERLNQLVHAAHNGGWAFNKFISDDELNSSATNPVYAVMKSAPSLYDALVKSDAGEIKNWFKYRCKFDFKDEKDIAWNPLLNPANVKPAPIKGITEVMGKIKENKFVIKYKTIQGQANFEKAEIPIVSAEFSLTEFKCKWFGIDDVSDEGYTILKKSSLKNYWYIGAVKNDADGRKINNMYFNFQTPDAFCWFDQHCSEVQTMTAQENF